MKKIFLSILSLIVLVTLSGCQDKFDPQTAIQESRTTLNEFLNMYSSDEKILDDYNKEMLKKFFTKDKNEYFSDNFIENILPDKLDNLKYDSDKEWSKLGQQFLFLNVLSEDKGVFWTEGKIKDDDIDLEKETVTFYVSTKFPSLPSGYIEMIKEKGTWKINNILEL